MVDVERTLRLLGVEAESNFVMSEAIDAINHLLAENARLQKAQEWQPMDTAPEDGTCILAIIDVWSFSTGHFLRWEVHAIRKEDSGEAVNIDGDDVGWYWEDFKFWKPLELPPEPTVRKGESDE